MAVQNDIRACSAAGCSEHANRKSAGLCEAHYARQRRYGDCNHEVVRPQEARHSQGYVLVRAPGHPLALGRLRIYEHRMVFFDRHGSGPFTCHWCKRSVTWDDMHVDHLNEVVDDNRIDNLVPACAGCNLHRNEANRVASLRRRFGFTVNGVTLTYKEWATPLGITAASLKARLAAGWDPVRAVTEQRGRFGPEAGVRRA